jgi:thiamine-phosphate pyrophosphorylase
VPPLPSALYVVCDADVCAGHGWNLVDFATACMAGGARLLQVRGKHLSGRAFLETTVAIVTRAESVGALVVVNDRADIARLSGAGGVHVGQEDLPPAFVRAVTGPTAVVGLSTHTVAQIDAAASEPVSYVAVGPVFVTATKDTGYDAVGLERVRYAAGRARTHGLPLVAIGGITLDNARAVLDAGASSVAVISDLVASGDPASRVSAFLDTLSRRS